MRNSERNNFIFNQGVRIEYEILALKGTTDCEGVISKQNLFPTHSGAKEAAQKRSRTSRATAPAAARSSYLQVIIL